MIQTRDDRAVDLLALAVVVSVGLAAAPVTWRVLGRDDGRREVAAIAAALPEATVDLTPVKTFAPFGTRIAAGVTGDPTAANLQLRGVLLAHPAAASVALISAGGGPAKGFAIGATLPGGAILDAVEFDLVILRANGQLVTLALPIKSGTGTPTVTAPVAVLPVSGARPALLPPTAAADPIEAYRARAQDPLSLLGTLGASAGPDGYRIGAAPSEDLKRAGLRAGDVVEKVNGEAVGNPVRDRALFDDAVVAGRMRVDVVRDGKHIALSFPLH